MKSSSIYHEAKNTITTHRSLRSRRAPSPCGAHTPLASAQAALPLGCSWGCAWLPHRCSGLRAQMKRPPDVWHYLPLGAYYLACGEPRINTCFTHSSFLKGVNCPGCRNSDEFKAAAMERALSLPERPWASPTPDVFTSHTVADPYAR